MERASIVLKCTIIAVMTAVIGIFVGKTIAAYETGYLLNREYCGSYRGIEVYKSGEINDENFLQHVVMLRDAPEKLVECCDKMYFIGGSLPIRTSGSALGVTQDSTVFITTDSYGPDVLVHELFHTYDNRYGASSSSDFDSIYEAEKYKIPVSSGYDEKHRAEFFATAGAVYIVSPAELLKKAPNTFFYINEILELYEVV